MIFMVQSILIAEDNQFTALQYNRILSKHGHQVIITPDGDECLKKYHDECKKVSGPSPPFDVVILDQTMPKKNGKEVANEILKSNPYQRIIFASAYALNPSEEFPAEDADNVEFLQKPFSLKKLIRQIGFN